MSNRKKFKKNPKPQKNNTKTISQKNKNNPSLAKHSFPTTNQITSTNIIILNKKSTNQKKTKKKKTKKKKKKKKKQIQQ
jgi:hypothetical protein